MKLCFIVFDPLFSSNFGYLARFEKELKFIVKDSEVSIINLGQEPESEKIKKKYFKINFLYFKSEFKGWDIINCKQVIDFIKQSSRNYNYDLIILQMEVWDLIREMHRNRKNLPPAATVVHAMPFLVAPMNPSGNLEIDIKKYTHSNIEKYKKEYIKKHYHELSEIVHRINIIANNNTVEFYLKLYFNNLNIWNLSPSIVCDKKNESRTRIKEYDFVYMASMISGKGTEHLLKIMKYIHFLLKRSVNLVVLGRTYDKKSEKDIKELLNETKRNKNIKVIFPGWADDKLKEEILVRSGVFIYPSYCDNYPTVVNEALSFSIPCVVWDSPYYKLNYSRTKAVYGAPFLNFKKFAEYAVEFLLNRRVYSKYALDFVNSFNSSKVNAKRNIKIFNEIINGKNK
jgi:hypothetical protein